MKSQKCRLVKYGLRTLHVVLKDLCEHGEEGLLETAHSRRVCLTGDPDGQTQWLKQVVIEMGLAGILDGQINKSGWRFKKKKEKLKSE